MSTATVPAPIVEAEPLEPPIWQLSVEQFEEMVRRGIISEKDPVYLWKGRLARQMAPNPPHTLVVMLCREAVQRLIPMTWHVREEKPLRLRLQPSLPEPDLAVVRGTPRDYSRTIPTTEDAALVVEVADSSLRFDRQIAADYAAEGVPVYWIVNLAERCVEVYSEPVEGTYRQRQVVPAEGAVAVVIGEAEVGRVVVREILPS